MLLAGGGRARGRPRQGYYEYGVWEDGSRWSECPGLSGRMDLTFLGGFRRGGGRKRRPDYESPTREICYVGGGTYCTGEPGRARQADRFVWDTHHTSTDGLPRFGSREHGKARQAGSRPCGQAAG